MNIIKNIFLIALLSQSLPINTDSPLTGVKKLLKTKSRMLINEAKKVKLPARHSVIEQHLHQHCSSISNYLRRRCDQYSTKKEYDTAIKRAYKKFEKSGDSSHLKQVILADYKRDWLDNHYNIAFYTDSFLGITENSFGFLAAMVVTGCDTVHKIGKTTNNILSSL